MLHQVVVVAHRSKTKQQKKKIGITTVAISALVHKEEKNNSRWLYCD